MLERMLECFLLCSYVSSTFSNMKTNVIAITETLFLCIRFVSNLQIIVSAESIEKNSFLNVDDRKEGFHEKEWRVRTICIFLK